MPELSAPSSGGVREMHSVVRPRFVSTHTGDRLLLGDAVEEIVAGNAAGSIEIDGDTGGGKSTAIKYLLECVGDRPGIYFTEIPSNSEKPSPSSIDVIARFTVAPWTIDDCIEYLLSVRKADSQMIARCMSATDFEFLEGCPELCVIALNELMENTSTASFTDAIASRLVSQTREDLSDLPSVSDLASFNKAVTHSEHRKELMPAVAKLLRHNPVRIIAAALRISRDLNHGDQFASLLQAVVKASDFRIRNRLTSLIAERLEENGMKYVLKGMESKGCEPVQSVLASVLAMRDPGWRPLRTTRPCLTQAVLRSMKWQNIDLRNQELVGADLSGSDLSDSRLTGSHVSLANFRDTTLYSANIEHLRAECVDFRNANLQMVQSCAANFRGAKLTSVNATNANFAESIFYEADLSNGRFSGTDFSGAQLERSRLTGADFSECVFDSAYLNGADLTNCRLDGASFAGAHLRQANLEAVSLTQPRFSAVRMLDVNLTGASFVDGSFRGALMTGCYMADIDLSGADLRGSDLSGSTFHMGSSRSGLVGSVIASEGTRTGFYDTDSHEASYRQPEEIRVANLRGCDLRGARITNVDFWRVDLRDAIYDDDQRRQLERTGAILS